MRNEEQKMVVFPRRLSPNPTKEEMAQHINYIQERAEFAFGKLLKRIKELEALIEQMEG